MVPASADRQIAIETPGLGGAPVAGPRPVILLAIGHPTMLALTAELLERSGECRVKALSGHDEELGAAIGRHHPHLVVIDTAQFPERCRKVLHHFPAGRMIVIGPDPGQEYRAAALAAGAGAWVARERIGDELMTEVRRLLAGRDHPQPDRSPTGSAHP